MFSLEARPTPHHLRIPAAVLPSSPVSTSLPSGAVFRLNAAVVAFMPMRLDSSPIWSLHRLWLSLDMSCSVHSSLPRLGALPGRLCLSAVSWRSSLEPSSAMDSAQGGRTGPSRRRHRPRPVQDAGHPWPPDCRLESRA